MIKHPKAQKSKKNSMWEMDFAILKLEQPLVLGKFDADYFDSKKLNTCNFGFRWIKDQTRGAWY